MAKKRRVRATAVPPARGFPSGGESNPFAETWNRRAANAAARSASSRAAAASRNFFADRRIGEDDPDVPEEDRYLARLQRARSSRARKRALFSLAEEDGLPTAADGDPLHRLTHEGAVISSDGQSSSDPGQPWSKRPRISILKDDYIDDGLDDTDDVEVETRNAASEARDRLGDSADVPQSFKIRESPENGSDPLFVRRSEESDVLLGDPSSAHRTHQEIMEEVVARSKQHKADRQREKAEVDNQTLELDSQLPGILRMLGSSSKACEPKSSEAGDVTLFAAERNNCSSSGPAWSRRSPGSQPAASDEFDYEKVYLELASEKRARATERTKTQEEKDAEERQRLEDLEKLRLCRMQNAEYDEGERKVSADTPGVRRRAHAGGAGTATYIGGDDLEDDFVLSPDGESVGTDESSGSDEVDAGSHLEFESGTSRCADKHLEDVKGSGRPAPQCGSVHDEREKISKLAGSNGDADLIDDGGVRPADEFSRFAWHVPPSRASTPDDALPFIYSECPVTSHELSALFEGLTCAQRGIILARLRKCFAKSLNPGVNGPLLERLLRALLSYLHCATMSATSDSILLVCTEADVLLPHVFELANGSPQSVIVWSRSRLLDVHASLTKRRNLGLARCVNPGQLVILRCISRLFPGSDLRHSVVTPLNLLLSTAIGQIPMYSQQDVACACFCVSILLSLLAPAGRFAGEVFDFFARVLVLPFVSSSSADAHRGVEGFGVDTEVGEKVDALSLEDCFVSGPPAECGTRLPESAASMRLKLQRSVLGLVKASLYEGNLKSVRACLDPVLGVLDSYEFAGMASLREEILRAAGVEERSRKPLSLYIEKRLMSNPKLLNPKFSAEDGVYAGKRKRSNGALAADLESQKRLRKQVRKEERGAARDLRRVAEAVNAIRQRDSDEVDAVRAAKTTKAVAFMQKQWHIAKLESKKVSVGTEAAAAIGRKRKKW